jgi:hypothetical protein
MTTLHYWCMAGSLIGGGISALIGYYIGLREGVQRTLRRFR